MKLLLLLIIGLLACTKEEININCDHTFNTIQGNHEDIISIKIISELESVTISVNEGPPFTVNEYYYNCINVSVPKDETSIVIIAEHTCKFIL